MKVTDWVLVAVFVIAAIVYIACKVSPHHEDMYDDEEPRK
jgi:hypothetical protein